MRLGSQLMLKTPRPPCASLASSTTKASLPASGECVVRLLPALNVDDGAIDEFFEKFQRALLKVPGI